MINVIVVGLTGGKKNSPSTFLFPVKQLLCSSDANDFSATRTPAVTGAACDAEPAQPLGYLYRRQREGQLTHPWRQRRSSNRRPRGLCCATQPAARVTQHGPLSSLGYFGDGASVVPMQQMSCRDSWGMFRLRRVGGGVRGHGRYLLLVLLLLHCLAGSLGSWRPATLCRPSSSCCQGGSPPLPR